MLLVEMGVSRVLSNDASNDQAMVNADLRGLSMVPVSAEAMGWTGDGGSQEVSIVDGGPGGGAGIPKLKTESNRGTGMGFIMRGLNFEFSNRAISNFKRGTNFNSSF